MSTCAGARERERKFSAAMAEELVCTPGVSSMASPSSHALPADHDFADLDLESFLLSSPSPTSPSSASASSPSTRIPNRSHPPLRHRRCLFEDSSPPADISLVSKLPRPAPFPTPKSDANTSCRKRGAYNCGRCGQPKRGHVCVGETSSKALVLEQYAAQRKPHLQIRSPSSCFADRSRLSMSCSPLPRSRPSSEASRPVSSSSLASSCSSNERSKRALQCLTAAAASESADASVVADADASIYSDNSSYDREVNEAKEYEALPLSCLVQILSRLFPQDLVAASSVCRRWRQCAEYVWAGLRKTVISIKGSNRVDEDGGFLSFILRKCSNLQQLTLDVTSHLGDQLLQHISTFRCDLSSLEVSLKPGGVNSISGEGIRDLFRHCRSLTTVKFEGCGRVVEVELSSPCLATLWLTGCHHLQYMFLDCSELSELCLDFLPCEDVAPSEQDHVKSDSLAAIMKNLASTARGLTRLHVASPWLQDRVIHGLFCPGLKSLCMLSLTFGLGITDHSVDVIAANCEKLELLDLSGSSITDVALELICKSFSTSLSKLLIALCPRVSQAGLQMVVAKLPLLQLLDCGKVITDKRTYTWVDNADSTCLFEPSHSEAKSGRGELRLHHQQLQKLSLWGCTGLRVLALDCPNLVDLNLTGCSRLQPGGLQLICPSLRDVYVGKCEEEVVQELHCQLELAHFDPTTVLRGQADGSKRVQALNLPSKFKR